MKKSIALTPLHTIFFYLTCALLPIQLGLHFWPSWAMVLGRRVDYLSPTIYLTDIFIVATLAFWVIGEWRRIKHWQVHPLFFVLLLVVFANIAFSKNIPVSVYQWTKLIEFVLFGFYIKTTKPKLEHLVTALSVAVFYSSVIALIQFFLQRSIGGPLWLLGERTFFSDTPGIAQFSLCDFFGHSCRLILRPYATFPHPNVLGGFLAVTLTFVLWTVIQAGQRTSGYIRYFHITSFVAGTCALIVTFGRSAWVAAIVGVLMVIYITLRTTDNIFYKKYMKWIVFCVLISFLTGVLYFSGNLFSGESAVVRSELNIAAFKMMQDNGLTGVGWGNFLTALPLYLTTRAIYFLQPVHNIYLLAASQLGVVGISFVIVCVFVAAKHVRKTFSISGVLFLLVLLLGLVDHYFLTLQQGQLLFAIVIGLFAASVETHARLTT